MAPEHDARTQAFYDHESDEPRGATRRRRQVADWGVGEDVFDRLPSRRFTRADRRAEHHDDEPGISRTIILTADDEPRRREPRAIADDAPRGDEPRRRGEPARGESRTIVIAGDDEPARGESRTIVVSADEPGRGESRTIVLAPADAEPARQDDPWSEPPREGRRTVVIHGRPDRLLAPRAARPPRTAMERVGARPDRIAGYAVALGFLLILIAILTTGQ
jgi:hypothetical protein